MQRSSFALRCLGCAAVAAALACASAQPRTSHDVASAYLEAGRYDDAVRESERLVRIQPRDLELRLLAAQANEGAGDLERALLHLEMAEEIAPSDGEAAVRIGLLEQRRARADDAYVAFRRATMLASDDLRAWRGLALTAEALGFEAEAERAYARWAELERTQGEEP
jgi:Flp pilus assembly protein TadD